MGSIFEAIITPGMAGLAAAAIAIMFFIGKIPYKGGKVNGTKLWKNWGEFLLVALCIGGAFAPGVSDIPVAKFGAIIIFGMISALVAHLGRKILKPIILAKLEGKEE